MTKNNEYEQPIDRKLIEKIELMGPTPDRDPLLASQGRERFLSELEGIPAAVPKSPLAWLVDLFKSGNPNALIMGPKNIRESSAFYQAGGFINGLKTYPVNRR